MPLNACSINTYSVDTICFAKRAKYIDILFNNPVIPPVVTTKSHGGWTGYRPDFNTQDEEKFDPSKLEHLFITLTTTFDGETIVNTWDNSPSQFRPMISINKLTSSPSDIHVEVTNLKILGKT